MQRYNVILKLCPFSGDKALPSTRKHAACTNGVKTRDSNFWTSEISMIQKGTLFVYSQNDLNVPWVNNLSSECLAFGHFRVALEQKPNATWLNPEISGCSLGKWLIRLVVGNFANCTPRPW
jgi:hypothetical protein